MLCLAYLPFLLLIGQQLASVAALPTPLPVRNNSITTTNTTSAPQPAIWTIPADEANRFEGRQEPQVRAGAPGLFQLGDLIVSDREYQRLLDRLRSEADNDLRNNPRNYVDENVDAEEIMRMFADNNTPAATSTITPELLTASELTFEALVTGTPDANSVQLSDANPQPVTLPADSSIERDCSICLQELSESKTERLECTHEFHLHCINRWALYNVYPNCPLCRTPTRFRPRDLDRETHLAR